MPNTIHGFFVFTREIGDRYVRIADAADVAAACGAPEWMLPDPPDARAAISKVLKNFGSGLRRLKMDVRKVKAGAQHVEYTLLGPSPSADGAVPSPKSMVEVGKIIWTDSGVLELTGFADYGEMAEQLKGDYLVACTVLAKDDWQTRLRQLFTGRWNGWSARSGGVVYWVAPEIITELAVMRQLLLTASGIDMLSAPCLSPDIAASIVELGYAAELASVRKKKMSAQARLEQLVEMDRRASAASQYAVVTMPHSFQVQYGAVEAEIAELRLAPPPAKGGRKPRAAVVAPAPDAAVPSVPALVQQTAKPVPERGVIKEITIGAKDEPAPEQVAAPSAPPVPAVETAPAVELPTPPPVEPEPVAPARWVPPDTFFDGEVRTGALSTLETYRQIDMVEDGLDDTDWLQSPEAGTYYCVFNNVTYVTRISD